MLKFYEDPGHGWLEVPVAELVKLGIEGEITSYSYKSRDGKMAYLEEDCDYSTYLRALGVAPGEPWIGKNAKRIYSDPCFVRSLPGYSRPMSPDAWSGLAGAGLKS